MKPISTLIIEDEPLVSERIQDLLLEDKTVSVVDICKNGAEGLAAIRRWEPELLFLDIQMPLLNGFDILAELPEAQRPLTIFITAYDQYAIRAFEFEAFDYLLKPFDRKRFFASLERAKKRLSERRRELPVYRSTLMIKDGTSLRKLPLDELVWARSARNYVHLHTRSGVYMHRMTLQKLEAELNPVYFRRIHRSCLINLRHIEQLDHIGQGDYRIKMSTGNLLHSSHAYRDNMKFILQK